MESWWNRVPVKFINKIRHGNSLLAAINLCYRNNNEDLQEPSFPYPSTVTLNTVPPYSNRLARTDALDMRPHRSYKPKQGEWLVERSKHGYGRLLLTGWRWLSKRITGENEDDDLQTFKKYDWFTLLKWSFHIYQK